MSDDMLVPTVTNGGLAAACAVGNGLAVALTTIGVGIGQGPITSGMGAGYATSGTQTALFNEVCRVPIISGAPLGENAFQVEAIVPRSSTPANYVIQEVGFYTDKGLLFAVWSSPQYPLAAKTALSDVQLAFDLFLQQLPPGSITVNVSGPSIPSTAGVLARLLAVQANAFAGRLIEAKQRLALIK